MPKIALDQAQRDWSKVTPNFDILETPDGIKGKLAGFDPNTHEPVVVWARNGLGFNDLSKQVKLLQERNNLEKHMNDEFNIDTVVEPDSFDLGGGNAQAQPRPLNEFNPDAQAQPAPRKGPKKDRFKSVFKVTRPDEDTVKENPNTLLRTKLDVGIFDKQTDKTVANTSLELRALTIPGIVEAALIGFQKMFDTMTRHKSPEERIAILKTALDKAAQGDVSAFQPGKRRTGGRKPRAARTVPLAVQAISMVRGIDMQRVSELWAKLSDAHREQLFNPEHPGHTPEQRAQAQAYRAKLAQIQQAQAEAAPDTEQGALDFLL